MRRGRSWRRVSAVIGMAVVASGLLTAALPFGAGAAQASDPVTISAPAGVATPWQSGQTVTVKVAANSTLDLSNLESSGGYHGEPAIRAEECDDPGGLAANLPAVPTNHCDGSTIATTSAVNADGSLTLTSFQVFALPDKVSLGEASNGFPQCGTQANQCVLYVGPDQLDFTKPHLFSAPFLVEANGTDQPGTTAVTTTTVVTANSAGVGASAAPPASDAGATAGGSLASTGLGPLTPWMLGGGGFLVIVGSAGKRRLRTKGVS